MAKKTQELLDKRAKLLADARAILDSAENGLSGENEEKYNKIDADITALTKQIEAQKAFDDLEKRLKEPTSKQLDSSTPQNNNKPDKYKQAFEAYMLGRATEEMKATLKVDEGSKGGYLVPESYYTKVIAKLEDLEVLRKYANVIKTASTHNIPIGGDLPEFGWIDELGAYPAVDETFGKVAIEAHKVGGILKVSEELLQDSGIDLEEYLTSRFAMGIAKAEDKVFAYGDGDKKPTGFAYGLTGVDLAAADAINADELIDIFHSLESQYRKNAIWSFTDEVAALIRKLKDNNGRYLFNAAITIGERDTLLGRPVETNAHMPALGEAGVPIIGFGDFNYYQIGDRGGMTVQKLDQLYAENGAIGFKVMKRVDAKRTLDEAFTAGVTP